MLKPIKLYAVSSKVGRSPYQLVAYVEATGPTEAIVRYCGSRTNRVINEAEGHRYRATLKDALPDCFWDMADYCRPPYMPDTF
jgi:hypothetical protein